MVAVCTKRFASLVHSGRVELRCASAEDLRYDAGRFTKACAVNTVYFWPDPAIPVRELWRVLCAGGRLVVGFGPPAAIRRLPVTKHGFTLYQPDQIRSLLEDAGFGIHEIVQGSGPRGWRRATTRPTPQPGARPPVGILIDEHRARRLPASMRSPSSTVAATSARPAPARASKGQLESCSSS
jgi:SAM-dependent methyltransferase